MRQNLQDWKDGKALPPSAVVGRASYWMSGLQKLLVFAKAPPTLEQAVSIEPCPSCTKAVASDERHCGSCGRAMDPPPLDLGKTLGESLAIGSTNKGSFGAITVATSVMVLAGYFSAFTAAPWAISLGLVRAAVLVFLLGYGLEVATNRISDGRAGLPSWGGEVNLWKSGCRIILLGLIMIGLPSLPLLPLAGMWAYSGNYELGHVLAGLALLVTWLALLLRQMVSWPWCWAALAARRDLPYALDTGAMVLQGGSPYFNRLWFLATLVAIFALAAKLLNGLPWFLFPLTAVCWAWGLVSLSDFMAALYRADLLRPLPHWPSSFRAVLSPGARSVSPKLVSTAPAGSGAHRLSLLVGLCLFLLFLGAYLPSRGKIRVPFLDRNGKVGLLNEHGWPAMTGRFDEIFPIAPQDLAVPAKIDSQWGYWRARGGWLVEPRYERASPFSDGLGRVVFNSLCGFVDGEGKEVIKPRYRNARRFHQGLAAVSLDGQKWGYISPRDTWVIDPQFANCGDFHDDLAPCRGGQGSWGYINQAGQFVITPRFSTAMPFHNGEAAVEIAPGTSRAWYGVIDTQGKALRERNPWPSDTGQESSDAVKNRYDRIYPSEQGLALFSKGLKVGYVKTGGKLVWSTTTRQPDKLLMILRPIDWDPM